MSTICNSSPFAKRILFQHLHIHYYVHSNFFKSKELKKKSTAFFLQSIYSLAEHQARQRELQSVLLWVVCRCLFTLQICNLCKEQQARSQQKCGVQK